MERAEFETRVKTAKEQASARWSGILEALGVPAEILRGRDCECPMCSGGKRGFRFDDKYGTGTATTTATAAVTAMASSCFKA